MTVSVSVPPSAIAIARRITGHSSDGLAIQAAFMNWVRSHQRQHPPDAP